jgi:hypothetical protein
MTTATWAFAGYTVYDTATDKTVCDLPIWPDGFEPDVNPYVNTDHLALIAAAPDLLAALQALLQDPYLSDPINDDRMAQAKAAVAKATGVKP